MTAQDWAIIAAAWALLALPVAGTMADRHRDSRRLARHRGQLNSHARRLVQIEAAQRGLATSTREPMNDRVWSGAMVPIPGNLPERAQAGVGTIEQITGGNVRALFTDPDPDDTVRLARPPALGDIEHVLTRAANRPHTGVELARALHRKPWDLLPELDRLVNSGRVELITGHTAGHVAYRLVETVRMPHQHLLPGASR